MLRSRAAYVAVSLASLALMLWYAVTNAFVWDEGYHLIAAQQIAQGKLPYIDFCFPQTPLNAYLNAAIIRLSGQHWQPIHAAAAFLSWASALLVAQYAWSRFPAPHWRAACACVAVVFITCDIVLMQFGTVGQAYGVALFFTAAAFRIAIVTPARVSLFAPFAGGVAVGIAAASTLLVAPMALVLLVWIWKYDRVGLPGRKAAAFLAGSAIPFLPIVWLFSQGAAQTWFNVVQYHAIYRRVEWPGATFHDLRVFTSLLDSPQALLLFALAAAGLYYVAKVADWPRDQRSEVYLAAALALAEGLYLCTPHPTFTRYFLLPVPFVTIVALPGLYFVASRFGLEQRPFWPATVSAVLMAAILGKAGMELSDNTTWPEYEAVAQKVREVTPPGGRIFADEVVYFALQTNPPEGMELSYSHVLRLPPERAQLLHIVSEPELKRQMQRLEFDTVQSCSDPEIERFGLPGPYRHRADVQDCTIFWK